MILDILEQLKQPTKAEVRTFKHDDTTYVDLKPYRTVYYKGKEALLLGVYEVGAEIIMCPVKAAKAVTREGIRNILEHAGLKHVRVNQLKPHPNASTFSASWHPKKFKPIKKAA